MAVAEADDVLITINEKLDSIVGSHSECCIFRVRDALRNVNDKSYEPEIISIGPYHRNKPHLQMMEEHKWRFLKSRRDDELRHCVAAMRSLEEKARRCYSEPIDISSKDFVTMLLLDGCFVLELIRKFKIYKDPAQLALNGPRQENTENDPVFRMEWILATLQRDLMLFENQLPFFVLCKLHEMIEPPGQLDQLMGTALEFFNDLLPVRGEKRQLSAPRADNIKHLLDLIHRCWSSLNPVHNRDSTWNHDTVDFIGSSTELAVAGIRFEKMETVTFDVVFNDGLLQIPVFVVEDRTESYLRNLIAHEQHCGNASLNIVTDYMAFFGCLIKSVEDVQTLSRHGILRSFVGDSEAVCRMFRTMDSCIVGPGKNLHYAPLFKKVNSHCDRCLNKWMASFQRKYIHSSWGIISILAASTLLLLALLQVIYQIKCAG
ncbi:OLC1v1019028C1 [Oldenlandia corymbosa var. corymbosa]|uniref:OLC1v1019028C1 n=1 Tax=Oldenlandia corymbosa var. corymbosa TaxID=529605 RepID=A0AAV1EDG2_OLDCO|nr:OLC1v1019028C1 [Oldenlandia corymbosa var. corymbosa]